jgi:MFS family permease
MGVLVLLPVPEKRLPPQRPSMAATGRLIVRRDVLLPSLISAVSQYATWAIPYGFLPILAQQLGASGVTQGMLMSLHIGVVTAGSLVAAAVAERFGSRRMVLVSFVILAGGIVGASACRSLPPLFVAEFFIGLSMGISYPVLMGLSIRDVDEASRTTAMGLHQAVYALGMFAGPWLSGMLAESIGLRPMFVVTAVATLALGLFLLRLLPPRMRAAG